MRLGPGTAERGECQHVTEKRRRYSTLFATPVRTISTPPMGKQNALATQCAQLRWSGPASGRGVLETPSGGQNPPLRGVVWGIQGPQLPEPPQCGLTWQYTNLAEERSDVRCQVHTAIDFAMVLTFSFCLSRLVGSLALKDGPIHNASWWIKRVGCNSRGVLLHLNSAVATHKRSTSTIG